MTIARRTMTVINPQSVIGFERDERDGGRVYGDGFLTIRGARVINLGFACPSCTYIFERIGPGELSTSPHALSSILNDGLAEIDDDVLDAVRPVLPSGDYVASLLPVRPRLVHPGTPDDYFANEYRRCTNRAHDPHLDYYRSRSFRFDVDGVADEREQDFHQLIVPLYPPDRCDSGTVNEYRAAFPSDRRPTALAISVLDIVGLSYWEDDGFVPEPRTQWILTHYLLDGHHKMLAASRDQREIQLLSLLRKGQGAGQAKFSDNLYQILDGR